MQKIKKPEKQFLLKDRLFSYERMVYLATLLAQAYPSFNQKDFLQELEQAFPHLELKQRITATAQAMIQQLPASYPEMLEVLKRSLPAIPEEENFIFAPYAHIVLEKGKAEKDLPQSLDALALFTQYFSAEFAIRYFINHFPKQTLAYLYTLAKNGTDRQRRLASEGLRPKLPWAEKITLDYKEARDILNVLFSDTARYVTRSVANHLHDISKEDLPFVIDMLTCWQESNTQTDKELTYIIRHALRTAIKKGQPEAMQFLGYSQTPQVSIQNFLLKTPQVTVGKYLEYRFDVVAHENEPLVIDYKITYANPRGRLSEKIFKLKTWETKKGEEYSLQKKHRLRQMSTKQLYTGEHQLAIQINGVVVHSVSFELLV